MLIKTTGLVIRQRNIGENDKMITILTKDYGIVEASAKDAKKTKGPLTAATQLLCYSEFCLYHKKNYYSVNSASTINSFYDLRLDVVKVSLAAYLCDLSNYISPTEEHSWGHLRFLLNTLHMISTEKKTAKLLKAIFELKIMSLNGFMPDLVACNECAEHGEGEYYFLPIEGVIYCKSCLEKSELVGEVKYELNSAVLHAMRHIIYSEDDKIFAFNLQGESLGALEYITENYTLIHTKPNFSSLKMYKQFTD